MVGLLFRGFDGFSVYDAMVRELKELSAFVFLIVKKKSILAI